MGLTLPQAITNNGPLLKFGTGLTLQQAITNNGPLFKFGTGLTLNRPSLTSTKGKHILCSCISPGSLGFNLLILISDQQSDITTAIVSLKKYLPPPQILLQNEI
jgi:hypothetical protein